MKKLIKTLTLGTLVLLGSFLNAQNSILFVNDNAVNPENTVVVQAALDQTLFAYDVFDAVAENRSPIYDELAPYSLVIWYTGTDGIQRFFWNGNDTDNTELMFYLVEGGSLWVMGNDFLFDRYASAYDFNEGDFVYDFLGVDNYFGQSYVDDGGLGVPQLDLVPGQTISTLDPILWSFSTLWYADACVPAANAQSIYDMGPDSYLLNDYSSAVFYNTPTYNALSFFFDPALMDSDENREVLFTDILNYFLITIGTADQEIPAPFSVYPNPVVRGEIVTIHINKNEFIGESISIYDASGRLVSTREISNGETTKISWPANELLPGVYFLISEKGLSTKFIVVGND